MKTIIVTHVATFETQVEVPDDATPEQLMAAVVEAVPKYPDIKSGIHFDPEEFTVLDSE